MSTGRQVILADGPPPGAEVAPHVSRIKPLINGLCGGSGCGTGFVGVYGAKAREEHESYAGATSLQSFTSKCVARARHF
jgi:hypothetical protein